MAGNSTISAALARASTSGRGIQAVEHDGRSLPLPYEALFADALHVAGGLIARRLVPGDRVGLVTTEVSGFIRAFFGITLAGLVPVPLFPPAQAGDVLTFVRQSRQDRKSTRLNSSHIQKSRMPSSA